MITDLKPFIGLRDPRLQASSDRYIEKLYSARVLLNRIRRAAAQSRYRHGWWLA